jgi:oleate hydratase
MENYLRANTLPPKGIEHKQAHIIGGGIGGLAAAAFLIDDAHMPAENITIYEAQNVTGGAMDATRSGPRFSNRGFRMLERRYECVFNLMEKIPSTQTPGLTVLDETYRANIEDPVFCHFRLMEKQGKLRPIAGAMMSPEDGQKLLELYLIPEEELDGMTIDQYFTNPGFWDSTFWICWAYSFGFRPNHSLVECKRYLLRFAMYVAAQPTGSMILHTQYNEYDSLIEPLHTWLKSKGVRFRMGTTVRDIVTEDQGKETLATALVYEDASGPGRIELTRDDLVFFTNGSQTQNSTAGDNNTAADFNRSTDDRGSWTVWEKIAARDPKFGRPATFISDIDQSCFYTFTAATTGYPALFEYFEAKFGQAPLIRHGMTTVVDSNWKFTFHPFGKKYYRGQPDDVDIVYAWCLFPFEPGNYIKKPMVECTGAEIFAEFLYHCGLEDEIDSILEHTEIATAALPYTDSVFVVRKNADRPKVIPDGCVNLAFMGQFVEVPDEIDFTIELSVRTAMMAVYGLTGLEKPMVPLYRPVYDTRVLADILKVSFQSDSLSLDMIDKLEDAAPASMTKLLDKALRRIPGPQW